MERSLEQRYAIKFCVKLGKNATETFQMLQEAFKDDCISRSQSGRWHKAFKEGREEVADEPRSGRPTTARTDENVDRVREVLRSDRRLSIQQIADTLHMSTFAVHGIVTEDLQMRKVCAKLVPHGLHRYQLPGPEQHPGGPPPPLQSRLGSMRLFFVSPTQERAERKTLGDRGKHPKPCYNVPDRHSRRGVSGCLSGVANTSPQVY